MPTLDGRSVLVTGAGGFLGGVIAAHLRGRGARVTATDRADADAAILTVNLENPALLERLDSRAPFDAVVHCAAALPGDRPERDLLFANLRMTIELASWAASRGARRFVMASSCNVYGHGTGPCTESTVPHPNNMYAVSKLVCEHALSADPGLADLRICSLRISAPYGPHLRRETVISRFLKHAAKHEPITLLGSGMRSQDFVYESDVATAFELAVAAESIGTFNISGESPITMRALAETASRLFGGEVRIKTGGVDPQESYRGHFPAGAAARAMGYRPLVGIREGLRLTARAWGLL